MRDVITAGELLEQQLCTPQCLLALKDDAACSCRCGGKYHGRLADAELPKPRESWWKKVNPWAPGLLEECAPIARTRRQANALYQSAVSRRGSPSIVRKSGASRWAVEYDAYNFGTPAWEELESLLLNRLMHRLLETRRVEGAARFPASYVGIHGVRELGEACVIWTVLGECHVGNVSTTVRAVEVLEGRPDPVDLGLHPEVGYPQKLAYEGNPANSVNIHK